MSATSHSGICVWRRHTTSLSGRVNEQQNLEYLAGHAEWAGRVPRRWKATACRTNAQRPTPKAQRCWGCDNDSQHDKDRGPTRKNRTGHVDGLNRGVAAGTMLAASQPRFRKRAASLRPPVSTGKLWTPGFQIPRSWTVNPYTATIRLTRSAQAGRSPPQPIRRDSQCIWMNHSDKSPQKQCFRPSPFGCIRGEASLRGRH